MPESNADQRKLCDYCDLPAAYAICVERACEAHASPQLREFSAMEIRRAARGSAALDETEVDRG